MDTLTADTESINSTSTRRKRRRSNQSNSYQSLDGLGIANQLETLRIVRINHKLTCVIVMLMCVLISSGILVILASSLLIFQQMPPIINPYVTTYRVQPGFTVQEQTVVSAIAGHIRMGLGFQWQFFRQQDPLWSDTITSIKTATIRANITAVAFGYQHGGLGVAVGASSGTMMFNTTLMDQSVAVLDLTAIDNNTITVLGFLKDTKKTFLATATLSSSLKSIVFFPTPSIILDYSSLNSTSVPYAEARLVSSTTAGAKQMALLYANTNSSMNCQLSLAQLHKESHWDITATLSVSNKEGCAGSIEVLQGTAVIVAAHNFLSLYKYHEQNLALESTQNPQCSPPWTWEVEPVIIDVQAASDVEIVLSCVSQTGHARVAYGALTVVQDPSDSLEIVLTPYAELPSEVDITDPQALQVASVVELPASDTLPEPAIATFVTYKKILKPELGTVRVANIESLVSMSTEMIHPVPMTAKPFSVAPLGNLLGVVVLPELPEAADPKDSSGFGLETGLWYGGISLAGIARGSGTNKIDVTQRDISSGFTGLIPGEAYYAMVNGSLTHAKTETFVGVARSSTELLIDSNLVGE